MSFDYWGIKGYGLCVNDIYDYIDNKKVTDLVRKYSGNIDEDNIFDSDVFNGEPFLSFGEFLCELDERGILSYEEDGQGGSYFLYEPPYPWHTKPKEPKSLEELSEHMVQILSKVCNASHNELINKLEYINTYGAG